MATTQVAPSSGQRQACSSRRAMPRGLDIILESLSKSILVHRPMNIYKFARDYLDAELDRRIIQELAQDSVRAGAEAPDYMAKISLKRPIDTPIRQFTSSVTNIAERETREEDLVAEKKSQQGVQRVSQCYPHSPSDGRERGLCSECCCRTRGTCAESLLGISKHRGIIC